MIENRLEFEYECAEVRTGGFMRISCKKVSRIVLLGIFLLLGILLVIMIGNNKPKVASSELVPIPFMGEYSIGDNDWQPLFNKNESVEDGHRTLSVRGRFEQDIPKDELLWLRVENIGIAIRINGKQVFDCNTPDSFPKILNAPGYSWNSIISPGITADDEIEIDILAYYGNSRQSAAALLNSIYKGDVGGLYQLLFQQIDLKAIVLIIAMVAGFIYLLEGGIYKLQGLPAAERVVLLGFYSFTGGLWCITDVFYPYFSLVISPPWLASAIDMMGVILFPLALMLLVRFFMRGKLTTKIMDGVVLVSVSAVFLSVIFQLCGILDLYEQQAWLGIIALIVLSLLVYCSWSDVRQFHDTYLWILLFAIVPVFISITFDSINMLHSFMPRRTVMQYGFTLSVILMISQIFSYAKQENETMQRTEQMKQELMESKVLIMLSQIQPHFLYNSLLGIKQLCDTEPKKASKALEHFSYYLRGNLLSISEPGLIPFEKELDHVRDYLYLEKMRFEERVNVQWEIGCTNFSLPPLTLQPIVENAVRHGITKKEEGGILTIRSEETADEILITVTDDGVGFDMSALGDKGCPHIGVQNVRKRLEVQCGAILQIYSEVDKGTKITVKLPRKE